ncbi:MAG TPA: hypothetical protein VN688_04555 [Gemmataceae bacterium]|nr:hypothetical protein [Gemmataceae bacterium]
MSEAAHGISCPTFVALDYDGETVAADDHLSVVLDLLRKQHDPADGEELAVWKNGETIAAVARADGSIHVFDQAAAQEETPPGNGNGKRRK